MRLNVIVTDGNYQNTNAIIRALKSKGLKVGVILNSITDLNFYSVLPDKKFFFKTNLLKSSEQNDFEKYWQELEVILRNNPVEVFMPVGNISCRFASLYKNKIEQYAKVPVVEIETMEIAQNKQLTFNYAEKLGIPIPKTIELNNKTEINDSFLNSIPYPCVIKKTNYNEGGVIYCNNRNELKNHLLLYQENKKNIKTFPVIQEYIKGTGAGYYGIYQNGACKGYFMHERIHEFPITGGASTLARSAYNEKLKYLGDKLLQELKWQGVAMVEFKKTSENEFVLMEVNPKFWGSLELSYAAGINFPYLNYLIALGKDVPASDYKTDIYFRWVFPYDLLWLLYSDKKNRIEFRKIKKNHKIFSNLHFDDPFVLLHNFLHFFIKLLKIKKYPHGHIKQEN
ncbi:ATP-grasp domain-containing protein [Ignavibacterium sp.]|uniref:carboxylate--amine ligase n=1 Tax=Ignavibacterium sp. TaxID=2651167 RepID=UPI0021FB08E9|nr:ATP-grasp domain-containing protein [Ignavibacterium sp.]BDQ02788.1 MAG: ATP-grasp protein [Ignavibacterium sp.]